MLKDGRSKGYGFVCFRTVDEASEAINDMNGKELGSKPIYVTLCKGQKEHSQSSNDRYLQQTNDTQKFHSIPRPRNVANYSEIPSTSSNRQTPSIVQFSNRLPSRLYLPFNYHQLQLDSSPDNHYSDLFLSALKSKQSMHRDENNSSTDDDEKNTHE
jgi:RNA recognition motif-containing protein